MSWRPSTATARAWWWRTPGSPSTSCSRAATTPSPSRRSATAWSPSRRGSTRPQVRHSFPSHAPLIRGSLICNVEASVCDQTFCLQKSHDTLAKSPAIAIKRAIPQRKKCAKLQHIHTLRSPSIKCECCHQDPPSPSSRT